MRVTNEIMASYQHMVSELTLVPGGGGVFDVTTEQDGEVGTIYSKRQTGRQANEGEVVAALAALLPAGTLRYGT
ncbi:MAG: putative Rdx family selenoprotein [Ilumatobacter sp.]